MDKEAEYKLRVTLAQGLALAFDLPIDAPVVVEVTIQRANTEKIVDRDFAIIQVKDNRIIIR